MTKEAEQQRSRRSRSDATTDRIRASALRMAHDLGPENVTVEGLAAAAGTAKTTIYRRWPNAAAVIMDAFLHDIDPMIRYRPGADLLEVMLQALQNFLRSLTSERRALLRHLIGAAQSNSDLLHAFWDHWIAPRRRAGVAAIMATGRSMDEAEIILDLLYGAVYYRLLIPHGEITEEWLEGIVGKAVGTIGAAQK